MEQVARYWRQTDGRQRLFSAAEFAQRNRCLPSYGIVEVMAQTGCLCWPVQQPNGSHVCFVNRWVGRPRRARRFGRVLWDPSLHRVAVARNKI
eukprot:2515457-Lingulodinium_polyedra.AAC.1